MASRPSRWNPAARASTTQSQSQSLSHSQRQAQAPQPPGRNLMSHHLSRRPQSANSASAPAVQDRPSTASTQTPQDVEEDSFETEDEKADEEEDDAVKNIIYGPAFPKGQSQIQTRQDPIEAAMEMLRAEEDAEDGDEIGGPGDRGAGGEDVDDRSDLIELYRSHSRQTVDAAELKLAILDSLRRKVNSLDRDKWIYEPDYEVESPI